MSKKTIGLIIALFVVTSLLLLLAIFPVTQKTSVSITPTPTITNSAQTVLAFAPPVASASALASGSATYSMDVNILTGKNKVNAVQLELSYDPKALVNVSIESGDFFENPVILLDTIDEKTGRISYAIALSPADSGKTATGTVAVLKFKPLGNASTSIKFLPKTQVAAEGVQQSVLQSTIDTIIFGGTSSATPSR